MKKRSRPIFSTSVPYGAGQGGGSLRGAEGVQETGIEGAGSGISEVAPEVGDIGENYATLCNILQSKKCKEAVSKRYSFFYTCMWLELGLKGIGSQKFNSPPPPSMVGVIWKSTSKMFNTYSCTCRALSFRMCIGTALCSV